MTDQLKIKSENSFLFYFLLMFLGGFGMIWISWYLLSGPLRSAHPDLVSVFLGGFFGLLGFLCLINIYALDRIFIYTDRFVVKSFFGNTRKVILLKDIITWTEIAKETRWTSWTDLTIYTEHTKYKLTSSIYNNYPDLKRALVKGKKRDLKSQDKWLRRNALQFVIGFAIFGMGSLYLAYYLYSVKDNQMEYSQLQTITDVIINKAEFKSGGAKTSGSISISLKSYPQFVFEIEGNALVETNTSDYVANVKPGDVLSLDIMKDEFQMKITKEKPLGFWDKAINYSFIPVYGLRDKNHTYLNLAGYNAQYKSDKSFGIWFFGLFGLFLVGSAVYIAKDF